jgi:hypothetical protein
MAIAIGALVVHPFTTFPLQKKKKKNSESQHETQLLEAAPGSSATFMPGCYWRNWCVMRGWRGVACGSVCLFSKVVVSWG